MNTKLGSLMLLLFSTALLTAATQVSKSWAAADGNWTQLTPAGTPPAPRVTEVAIYDPVRDRMIIFGGFCRWCGVHSYNDVWALSLGVTPQWTQLFPAGTLPSTRESS